MRATLIGWNGKSNVGDDAMTEVIFSELEKLDVSSVLIIGKNSKEAYSYLSKYDIRLFFPPFYEFFNSFRGLSGLYHRYFLSIYIALNSKLIIIGGGTLFHTVGGMRFYENIARFINFFKLKRKIISTGVSVGPFRDVLTEPIFKNFVRKVNLY